MFWLYHNVSNSFQPTNKKQADKVQKNIKERKPFSLYIRGDSDSNDQSNSDVQNNKSDNSFLSSVQINPNNNTTTITKMNPNQNINHSSKNKKNNKDKNNEANTDNDKLNQAQQNLGIPTDASYIDINGAKNIVNQSNGLAITPTQTFNSDGQQFTAGKTVTLNGDQALAYAKGGGSNQHQLLSSFVSKNSDIKSFLSPSMVKEISSYTKTNLSPDDISQLYQHYRGALQNIQYK